MEQILEQHFIKIKNLQFYKMHMQLNGYIIIIIN